MELFSAKTGTFEDKTPTLMRPIDTGSKMVYSTGPKEVHRRQEIVSSPTDGTITSSSSLSSISSISTASTLSSYIDQVLPTLPPSMDNDNAHCTPNASPNCSTQTVPSSSSSTNNPALLLVEPVTLEPFVHQVGGHSSVLRFDATTVCKPLIQREKKFYESKIPSELKPFIPQFRGILEVKIVDEQDGFLSLEGHKIFGSAEVLEYHRTQSLNNSQASQSCGAVIAPVKASSRSKLSAQVLKGENCEKPLRYRFRRTGSIECPSESNGNEEKSSKTAVVKEAKSTKDGKAAGVGESRLSLRLPQRSSSMVINPWNVKMVKAELEKMRKKDTNNKYKFLLQENAVHSFRCPTIIDLKMGTRQYGDDASEEKKKRFIAKSEMSTTAKLGVRLCGLQVYHVPMKKYIYVDKYKGRHYSVDGFKRILFIFLFNGSCLRLDVVDVVLDKLRDLYDIVSKLKSYRFFSSSLLIGYDASQLRAAGCAASPLPSPQSSIDATSLEADVGTCASLNQKCSLQPEPKEQQQQQQQQSLQHQQRQALATSSMVNKNVPGSTTSSATCTSLSSTSSSSSSTPSLTTTAQQQPQASSLRHTASNPPLCLATENLSSPRVDLKMIDFAHTTTSVFADEIVYEGPDDGYLFGLQSMICIFEEIKRMSPTEHQQIISSLHSDSYFSVGGKS